MEIAKNFAEIERKFLLKDGIPSGLVISTIPVHRHYLYADSQVEMRIQRKGKDCYELERKIFESPLLRWSMETSITIGEYKKLRKHATGNQIHYLKHDTDVSGVIIKEYLDQLAGLLIVEVEFTDLQSAQNFHPAQPWIGREITDLTYSRDSGLIYVADFNEFAAKLFI
jgi:CYTH domain-containing protein